MNAFLAAVAVAAGAAGQQGLLPPKQYLVEVTLYQGDPLGSREDKTLRVLTEPKAVTASGRSVFFQQGGQIALPARPTGRDGDQPGLVYERVGTSREVLPIGFANGKVYLEITVTSRTADTGRGIKTEAGFVPGFNEQQTRVARVDAPGKPLTVRLSAASPADQTWAVVAVSELKR